MPQIHTYVEARLAKWAIWCHWGSSGKPQKVVSWYEKVVMAPNVQGRGGDSQPCPVDEAEAHETHRAIGALAPYLRATIVEHWMVSGTAEMKARRLGICRDQFYERLNVANHKLLGYLNDLAAGVPLPAAEANPKRAKKRYSKKPLTLPDTFRTFAGRLA